MCVCLCVCVCAYVCARAWNEWCTAVTTSEPLKKNGPTEFSGTLHERTEDKVVVNAKGRMIKVSVFLPIFFLRQGPHDQVCLPGLRAYTHALCLHAPRYLRS